MYLHTKQLIFSVASSETVLESIVEPPCSSIYSFCPPKITYIHILIVHFNSYRVVVYLCRIVASILSSHSVVPVPRAIN